jgi:hypothetical protein
LNLPSLKVAETFDLSTFGPTFEGGWNGWFSETMFMEKPNTKMARTAKNRARSFTINVRNFKLNTSLK